MDVYDEEILSLWRVLNRYQVRYILIGGFAVNLHKHYRTTADIDIYTENTLQNRLNLAEALDELNLSPKELVLRMQFVPGWSVIHLHNGFPLDIMTTVKGLEYLPFDECYRLASTACIEDVSIKFLHYNHLIESKKAANLLKDQIDILALEEIRKVNYTGR